MDREHVMLVEDEDSTRRALSFILRHSGYQVTEAENGSLALSKMLDLETDACPVDILVTDLMMPVMSGLELIESLTEKGINLPIIILTGFGDKQTVIDLMRHGCSDFLEKPFEPNEVVDCIRSVLKKNGNGKRSAAGKSGAIEVELKEAETELARRKKNYFRTLNAVPAFIFELAPGGAIKYLNQTAADLLGITSEAIKSLSFYDFLADEKSRKAVESLAGSEAEEGFTINLNSFDGRIAHLESRVVKMDEDGVDGHYLIIAHDVGERRSLESQLLQAQKIEVVGSLIGGAAHDFNNMLAIIFGYIRMAMDDVPKGGASHTYLKKMQKASEKASQIVRQILLFSRNSEREKLPVSVGSIVRETINLFQSILPSTIEIRTNLTPDSDLTLGSPTQIYQIIMNLCINAIQAIGDLPGVIDVQLEVVASDQTPLSENSGSGRYLKLSIGDSGKGIDPVTIDSIFDPFFTTKDADAGTGMGLWAVRNIVRQHGGIITAESRLGEGSWFHVYLPKYAGDGSFNDGFALESKTSTLIKGA